MKQSASMWSENVFVLWHALLADAHRYLTEDA